MLDVLQNHLLITHGHKWQMYDVLQNHLPFSSALWQNSSDLTHWVGLEAWVPLAQVDHLFLQWPLPFIWVVSSLCHEDSSAGTTVLLCAAKENPDSLSQHPAAWFPFPAPSKPVLPADESLQQRDETLHMSRRGHGRNKRLTCARDTRDSRPTTTLSHMSFVKRWLRLVKVFIKHHKCAIYGLVWSVNGLVKHPTLTIMVLCDVRPCAFKSQFCNTPSVVLL